MKTTINQLKQNAAPIINLSKSVSSNPKQIIDIAKDNPKTAAFIIALLFPYFTTAAIATSIYKILNTTPKPNIPQITSIIPAHTKNYDTTLTTFKPAPPIYVNTNNFNKKNEEYKP